MEWHPFAARFGWIDNDGWPGFLESIKATGGNEEPIRFRIVNGRQEGLDGRNRERACKELGLPCRSQEVQVSDEDVKAYIIRHNVHRRHLTKDVRREIVAELRADGQSSRQIAETLNVSHQTVINDLNSGVKFLTPEPDEPSSNSGVTFVTPEKVTGKDGKQYSARRPSPEPVEVPQRHPDDEVQRHPDDMPTPSTPDEIEIIPPSDADVVDEIGRAVPRELADVFDPQSEASRQKCLTLCRQLRDELHAYAASPAGDQLRRRLSREGRTDETAHYRSKELIALTRLIEHWAPYASVCPYCAAKGKKPDCNVCYGTNWVCKDAWQGAPQDYRDAVLEPQEGEVE